MKTLIVTILVLSIGQVGQGQVCQKTRLQTREVVKLKKLSKLNVMLNLLLNKKNKVTEYKEVPYKTVRQLKVF